MTWQELKTETDKALNVIEKIEVDINNTISEEGIRANQAWLAIWKLKQVLEYKLKMYGRNKTNTGEGKLMD